MHNDFFELFKFRFSEQLEKKPNRFHDIERRAILKSIAVFANRNPQPQPGRCGLVGYIGEGGLDCGSKTHSASPMAVLW